MAEYIEREKAQAYAREGLDLINKSYWTADEVRDFLGHIPAADVRPVIHARWIDRKHGSATCSNCKRIHKDVYDDDNMDAFCRSCGARMEVQDG